MIRQLAWRNIWRNRVRSMAVILALAAGLFGALFISGMANGIAKRTVIAAIERETADLQIHQEQFLIMEDLNMTFLGMKLAATLHARPEISHFSFRVKTPAMASTANNAIQVNMLGVDPASEQKVSTIYSLLEEGDYLEDTSNLKQVIISTRLADKLKVRLKSKIIFSFADVDGEIAYENYKVGGIYKTNNAMFDEVNVFVKREGLRELLKIAPGQYHEAAIRIQKDANVDLLTASLNESLGELKAESWKELNPTMSVAETSMEIFKYILVMIVLIALVFGIINTMLMVILERTKEIGMLRSLGMAKARIARMIMLETIYLCLVGGLIGNAITFALVSYFGNRGIHFESFQEGFEQFGYSAEIFPEIEPSFYGVITIMVVVTAIFASFFPIMRAFKLDLASAIRD
jgi:putative ABC transport system permease protein